MGILRGLWSRRRRGKPVTDQQQKHVGRSRWSRRCNACGTWQKRGQRHLRRANPSAWFPKTTKPLGFVGLNQEAVAGCADTTCKRILGLPGGENAANELSGDQVQRELIIWLQIGQVPTSVDAAAALADEQHLVAIIGDRCRGSGREQDTENSATFPSEPLKL